MPNYFLYVRKSTDVEDKQVRSIEDQLVVLRDLAKSECLNIIDEFIEKQSAKRPGRPVFNSMMARIGKGEAQGIVCWKLDRLARNPVDAAQIEWLLQESTIQHIQTHDRSYRSADNVMLMNVEFGIANQYIRDLSVNTKRGLYEKAKRGEYPGLAPLGYLNDLKNKSIILNKQKAPIIKQAFERYSQNCYSLEDIAVFLFANGIETKKTNVKNGIGGRAIKRDQAAYILANPFYCGLFRYGGELFQGKHEPLVSKQLFDKVQDILKQRSKNRVKVFAPQPLCGLLRCAECHCMITAENKTKHQKNGNIHHYTYYHCGKRRQPCSQPCVRSEELEKQLSKLLSQYAMPKAWEQEWQGLIDMDEKESAIISATFVRDLRSQITEIDRRLQRLKEMYLDQDIEREDYRNDKNKLVSEKKSLEEQIDRLEQKDKAWLEPLKEFTKTSQTLNEIAVSPSLAEKKSFAVKVFGSNLFLQNKIIVSTPQTQWAALCAARKSYSENPKCFNLVGRVGIEPTTNSLRGYCSTN